MIWLLPCLWACDAHLADVVNFDGCPTTGIIVLRPPERRPILRLSPRGSPFPLYALLSYQVLPLIRQVALISSFSGLYSHRIQTTYLIAQKPAFLQCGGSSSRSIAQCPSPSTWR